MEEKFNEATTQRPQGDRIMDAPLVTIDLRSFTKQIRDEKAWKDSDRNAITVFKTDGMRIVPRLGACPHAPFASINFRNLPSMAQRCVT